MLDVFILALCLALVAVTWAVVLVDSGMLLEPVQRWLRAWYRKPYRPNVMLKNPGWPQYWPEYVRGKGAEVSKEIDDQWWWKPLWGCYKCVAGQLGLWGYLAKLVVLYRLQALSLYSPWHHLLTICATIFFACILNKLYQWSQQ